MDKLKIIDKIREIYRNGGNIMEFLKNEKGNNDIENIMISYDFQAGSYIKIAKKNSEYITRYTEAIINELKHLKPFGTIMEVGVGESTLMCPLMKKLDHDNEILKFGFDISWSRIRFGRSHALNHNQNINFFVANLFNIPLPDNCIDIVYTSHSLEPNGGKEKEALRELYRVSKKYVLLLEPDYEGADSKSKERMNRHGYVKNLAQYAKELGYNVIVDRPFEVFINFLNPTRIIIIQKDSIDENNPEFICPISKTFLNKISGNWFSEEAGLLYPEIDEIPCLTEKQVLLATKYSIFNS